MKPQNNTTYFNIKGKLVSFQFPAVMGIVNLSPESFYEHSHALEQEEIENKINKHLAEGAAIIDIGAASSKPGSPIINPADEQMRLETLFSFLQHQYNNVYFSIDTYHASTAAMAIAHGFSMVNDISAGNIDPQLPILIAEKKVPYIIMHMQGTPETMQINPHYQNTVQEVLLFLKSKMDSFYQMGILDLIIDPGFGFGKTTDQNFELLKNLSQFQLLDCPVLVGLSRKSMINKTLGIKAAEALNGTTVLNTIALQNGANILRVHDVKEAMQAIQLTNCL